MVFVRGMPHGCCDSMDVVDSSFLHAGGVLLRGVRSWNAPWALWLISPSFVLEVCFFVVFVCGMPHGRCDSMDVVDFSFLRTGGVLLRGVLSWECPVGIMISMGMADFRYFVVVLWVLVDA